MEAVTFKKLVKGHAYSVTALRQVSAATAAATATDTAWSSCVSFWMWVILSAGGVLWPSGASDPHQEPLGSSGVDRRLE